MATVHTRAQMATYGQETKKYKWNSDKGRAQIVLEKTTINFANFHTSAGTTAAANDVYPIFDIEPKETVLCVGFNVSTAGTTNCDLDIGLTSGDVDGFVDGIEADDTTPTVVAAPFGLLSGTRFAAADTIDAKALTAATGTLVADFWVLKLRIG